MPGGGFEHADGGKGRQATHAFFHKSHLLIVSNDLLAGCAAPAHIAGASEPENPKKD